VIRAVGSDHGTLGRSKVDGLGADCAGRSFADPIEGGLTETAHSREGEMRLEANVTTGAGVHGRSLIAYVSRTVISRDGPIIARVITRWS
jgi:hypothetical protein